MSTGLYVLSAGATDLQRPHHEDEMYYVVRGRARFKAGSEDREVSTGNVIFVAAEVGHRFYDITEELAVLVFFAPAETSSVMPLIEYRRQEKKGEPQRLALGLQMLRQGRSDRGS